MEFLSQSSKTVIQQVLPYDLLLSNVPSGQLPQNSLVNLLFTELNFTFGLCLFAIHDVPIVPKLEYIVENDKSGTTKKSSPTKTTYHNMQKKVWLRNLSCVKIGEKLELKHQRLRLYSAWQCSGKGKAIAWLPVFVQFFSAV